jgi:hypothetical protein
VQYEPWLERDKAMIDQLKSIGIEKGKPFKPDPKTQMILNGAAREANAWLAARYDDLFHPPYFETSRWAVPATPDVIEAIGTHFAKADSYPVDSRGRRMASASLSTTARLCRSTSKLSFAPIATHYTQELFSISTQDRSRSRYPTQASVSCRCR